MSSPHVHIPYPKVGEYLAFINQTKLDLEIYFPSSALDSLGPSDIRRLKETFDHNPSLSIHAPFMDLSPGAVDSRVKAVTLERFSQIMDIAEVLLPKAIVFHSGYEKWKYAHRVDIWLEGSLTTWKPLIARAEVINTRLVIENIFEDEPSSLLSLMQELHSEHFGICFDTGHCNLFTGVSLQDWLRSLGPYIFELHLHDNDGSFDQHLPIGEGTFDFRTLFSSPATRKCLHTIEAHSPARVMKSIERLKEYTTAYPSGF